MKDRILFLFNNYQKETKVQFGKFGFLALAGCLYAVIREQHIPLTLSDIFVSFYFFFEKKSLKVGNNT